MTIHKVEFTNFSGDQLYGRIDFPADQQPHAFAIFAHCFTCSKNFIAGRNIARRLNQHGFAVLRFDFTGLGDSEGDFAQTNFSSNVADLISAAHYLTVHYQAPKLMVGHSFGGTASIFAAAKIASIQAIATIGALAEPDHIKNSINSKLDEIKEQGTAQVSIGGRPFNIKKEFLDDIQSKRLFQVMKEMRKPLIVLHSPQDKMVPIDNAAQLYNAAHHPKSFISLDGADHLLTRSEDSNYTGNIIANWAIRYLDTPEKSALSASEQAVVRIGPEDNYTTEILAGKHPLTGDEPVRMGGNDFGPSPYEFLLASLGSCTAITIRMYAQRKAWNLAEVVIHLNHRKEEIRQEDPSEKKQFIDVFEQKIQLSGDLTDQQRKRIFHIAKKCPVHRTLANNARIDATLIR